MAKVSTASAGLKFQYVRALAGVKMSGTAFRVLMVYWDHARADLTNSYPKRETVWKEAAIELDCTAFPIKPRAKIKSTAKIPASTFPNAPLNAARM